MTNNILTFLSWTNKHIGHKVRLKREKFEIVKGAIFLVYVITKLTENIILA